jgi:hypothetical protein
MCWALISKNLSPHMKENVKILIKLIISCEIFRNLSNTLGILRHP